MSAGAQLRCFCSFLHWALLQANSGQGPRNGPPVLLLVREGKHPVFIMLASGFLGMSSIREVLFYPYSVEIFLKSQLDIEFYKINAFSNQLT
jgi:hypothetical protein